MKILVLGKNGQVGTSLLRLQKQREAEWVFAGRDECDLTEPASVRSLVRSTRPQVIINAAAYTAVDQAERDQDLCFAVNATAPGVLAEEAAKIGALLIHYSSDYVFNGEKPAPYQESDPTDPLNIYGASKAAGEQAIAAAQGRYWILRTSWVYSSVGKNFLLTMLRLGSQKRELSIVDDQIGAPTSARDIAEATIRILPREKAPSDPAASAGTPTPSGIYHMSAGGSTSWCGFAREIFLRRNQMRGKEGGRAEHHINVIAISSRQYPTAAQRPRNSLLANDKFENAFGFRLAPWQEQLARVLFEIKVRELE